MLGGLARRAALVEKTRTQGQPVLVVDSGDLFFTGSASADPERSLIKARLIGRAYKHMGAAAINVGDLDLLQGLDFLQKEASQGLPLISANLLDSVSKTPVFPPYVIHEISGIRVAFFGLLAPEFRAELSSAIQKAIGERILIKDPLEATRETLEKLRGRADLIVLLSDLNFTRDYALARSASGIHFILGGHDGRLLGQPHPEGRTHIVQSSAKGMYVGKLQLTLANPDSPFQDKGKVNLAREQIRNLDRYLQALLKEQESRPSQDVERRIQGIHQQKAKFQEEIRRSSGALSKGNLFLWTLIPLDMNLPEDKEVQGWISNTGIDKD